MLETLFRTGPLRPLCVAAFAFALSMVVSCWLLPYGTAHIACLAALPAGLLLLCFGFAKKGLAYLKTIALAVLALAIGFAWWWGYDRLFVSPAALWDGQTALVQAEALGFPQETDYGSQLPAMLTMEDGSVHRAILFLNDFTDVQPGDTLTLTVKCSAPQPGTEGDVLANRRRDGIQLRAIQSGGDLSVSSPEGVSVVHWPVFAARAIRDALAEYLPAEQAALAQGLLLGGQSGLSEGFRAALGDSGMAHTVSVSGLHISFLLGAIILLVGNRKRAFWLGIPLVFLFVAVAGFPASAVRAGIMQGCLLFSYVLGREEDTLTALSLALLVLLALNPYAVTDAGLQLSFASTLGILMFAGRFQRALEARKFWPQDRLRRLRRFVFSSLSVSLSVVVFSAPLAAFYFDTFSLVSPIANLLTLGLVSFLFLGCLLLSAFSFVFAPFAAAAAAIMGPALWLFEWILTALSRIPFAALKLQSPFFAFWGLLAYGILWMYLLWPRKQEERRLFVPVVCLATTLALSILLSRLRTTPLEIQVLDVGQGQCILVLTPDKTMVIDCGGNVAHVARVAADALKSVGRGKIDLLAITHAHADHAGAVSDLIDMVEVVCIALPAAQGENEALQGDLPEIAQRRGIVLEEIDDTVDWPLGPAAVTMYPPLGMGDENELCMSMLIHMGSFDLLVTGDMDQSLERTLLRVEELPDIEVLVVGHHGSKYSTSEGLLGSVTPETAIISVGRNNYGHPAPDTMERLWQRGIVIYRTDEQGTVRIRVSQ